jgi:hypothetical protein
MSDRDITDTPVTLVGTYRSRPRKALRLRPIDEAFREVPEIGPRLGLINFLIPKQSMMPVGRLVSPVMLKLTPKLGAPSLGVVTVGNRTLEGWWCSRVQVIISEYPLLLAPGIVAGALAYCPSPRLYFTSISAQESNRLAKYVFSSTNGASDEDCSRTGPCDGKVIPPRRGEPEPFHCVKLVRFALLVHHRATVSRAATVPFVDVRHEQPVGRCRL